MFTSIPSYTAALNSSVSNIGSYGFNSFDRNGDNVTLPPPLPLAGLRFGQTTFSYRSMNTPLMLPSLTAYFVSPRLDIQQGSVEGIKVLSGRLFEFGFLGAFFDPHPETNGFYIGPGQVIDF